MVFDTSTRSMRHPHALATRGKKRVGPVMGQTCAFNKSKAKLIFLGAAYMDTKLTCVLNNTVKMTYTILPARTAHQLFFAVKKKTKYAISVEVTI